MAAAAATNDDSTSKQPIDIFQLLLDLVNGLDRWSRYYVFPETYIYDKECLERQMEDIRDIVYGMLFFKITGDDMFLYNKRRIHIRQFKQEDISEARYLFNKRDEQPRNEARWSILTRSMHGISNMYADELPEMDELREKLEELKMRETVRKMFSDLYYTIRDVHLWEKYKFIDIFGTRDFVLATAQPLTDNLIQGHELQNEHHYGWIPRLKTRLEEIYTELLLVSVDASIQTD